MFTKADILARLQNGESTDAIAQEMANTLNEAAAEKKALDAEKAAKEKEETRILEAKREAVEHMLAAVADYLVIAGEGDFVVELKDIDVDKVIELLDGSIKMSKSLEKFKELQFPLFGINGPVAGPKAKVAVVPADLGSADQVIDQFLKNFGL